MALSVQHDLFYRHARHPLLLGASLVSEHPSQAMVPNFVLSRYRICSDASNHSDGIACPISGDPVVYAFACSDMA